MVGQRLMVDIDGSPLTCCGCGAPLEAVKPSMMVPTGERSSTGTAYIYVVCGPFADGRQPCVALARAKDRSR